MLLPFSGNIHDRPYVAIHTNTSTLRVVECAWSQSLCPAHECQSNNLIQTMSKWIYSKAKECKKKKQAHVCVYMCVFTNTARLLHSRYLHVVYSHSLPRIIAHRRHRLWQKVFTAGVIVRYGSNKESCDSCVSATVHKQINKKRKEREKETVTTIAN